MRGAYSVEDFHNLLGDSATEVKILDDEDYLGTKFYVGWRTQDYTHAELKALLIKGGCL